MPSPSPRQSVRIDKHGRPMAPSSPELLRNSLDGHRTLATRQRSRPFFVHQDSAGSRETWDSCNASSGCNSSRLVCAKKVTRPRTKSTASASQRVGTSPPLSTGYRGRAERHVPGLQLGLNGPAGFMRPRGQQGSKTCDDAEAIRSLVIAPIAATAAAQSPQSIS